MSLWSNFIQWFLPPPGSAPSTLTQVMKENPKPEPAAKPKAAKPKSAAKPKAKAKPRAKKPAFPKETEDSLNKMTKASIQALAKKNLKIDLDSKITKKAMIENFMSAQK